MNNSSKKASMVAQGIKLEKVEKKGRHSHIINIKVILSHGRMLISRFPKLSKQRRKVIQILLYIEIEEQKEEDPNDKKLIKGGPRDRGASKQEPLIESSELLQRVGITDYVKRLPMDFINNRMMYGYIGKRSKGKMKYF